MNSTSTIQSLLLKKLLSLIVIICYCFYSGPLAAHPTTYANVGDFVWVDQNANGMQDVGEPGVANVTVKLLNSAGTVVATTTTNSSGKYSFTNVYVPACAQFRVQFGTPGQYTWTTKQAPGSTVTNNSNADANGLTDAFTLCAGDNNPCIDAGIRQSTAGKATIGDLVWVDQNGNGIQDSGEPGVANVTVRLLNSAGSIVATTTTNSSGIYFFTNVSVSACGQYRVQFGAPGQYTWTTKQAAGSTVTNNSNADANGLTDAFTVCPGDYNTCIDGGIRNSTLLLNPDINVTYVNVPVPGNVSTNDVVPSGTTYGTTPTLVSKPTGSTATLTMNSNGTYTFVANTVGVYTYNVPVCSPGQASNCPSSLLTITVLDKTTTNPPVANTDIAVSKQGTPVTINSLANDRPGNAGGTLNSAITVTSQPKNGTVTVNTATGATTYTPAAGFVGMDTLTYQVCETPSGKCATALQIIKVEPSNAANTTSAADDYATTPVNTAVSGNVSLNDVDPEGNAQIVSSQTSTVAGKGTLVLNSNGTYTFTPVTGFTGPVSFVYTTCDIGAVPQACASATLYVLVTPASPTPNLTPIIEYLPSITHGTQTIGIVTTVAETKGNATSGEITVYVARDPKYTIVWNPAATTVGGKAVNNSVWTLDTSNPGFYIFRTTSVIAGNSYSRFGFNVTFNPNNSNGQTTITATILPNSGGETTADANDNVDSDILIYFLQ
jgi:hypothetical protein